MLRLSLLPLLALLLTSCSTTPSVNWNDRVGTYTWDEALTELGTPTTVTELKGGVKSAEWIKTRGLQGPTTKPLPAYTRTEIITPGENPGWTAPDKVLRLLFAPDGKLIDWNRNY